MSFLFGVIVGLSLRGEKKRRRGYTCVAPRPKEPKPEAPGPHSSTGTTNLEES